MKVSILMPVHLVSDADLAYFSEALDSALAQTHSDIEIVAVNDHSKRRWTWHKRNHRDPRIRWLVLSDKSGVSAARNFAAFNATGELLLPLDHDDKAEPYAVEKMVAAWENSGGVIYSDLMLFGSDHQKLFKCGEFGCNGLLKDVLMWNSSLFSKDAWTRTGGWNEELDYLEDWDLNLKFIEKEICGFHIQEPLFWYRQRPDSRMAKLKSDSDAWTQAHAKLRAAHADFFNGRLRSMCCGGGQPAPVGTPVQVKNATIEGDRAGIKYVGNMKASFGVRGPVTGIRYTVPGQGYYLQTSDGQSGIDPRDAPIILSMNRGQDFISA